MQLCARPAVLLAWGLVALLLPPLASAGVEEFALPAGWRGPTHLAFDTSGSLWVALELSWAVGRYDLATRAGVSYPLPTPQPSQGSLGNVVIGPDDTVWIGTPTHLVNLFPANGTFRTYQLPVRTQLPGDIHIATDGVAWLAMVDADLLVNVDPATGKVATLPLPDRPFGPIEFVDAPDGGFYLTGTYGNTYARFDPVTRELTSGQEGVQGPVGIDRSREGALWIAEMGASSVSRVDPANGTLERFPTTPSPYYPLSGPAGILVGDDGIVWFIEHFADRFARLDPKARTLHEYEVPSTPGTNIQFIARAPDGALWTAEASKAKLARVMHAPTLQAPAIPGSASVPAGGSLELALEPQGHLVAHAADPALNATIRDGKLVLTAAADARGSYNVLVSLAGAKETAGRYLSVEIVSPAKSPGPAPLAFLALSASLAWTWRRSR